MRIKPNRRHAAGRAGEPGAGRSVCAVPSASFRLLPNGQMDACCINDQVWLGRYPELSLHEAWRHPALIQLREALSRADFSHGCSSCGNAYAAGERHLTHAESFDRFLDDPPADRPKVIEFSLSNQCNLACVMCSGDVSSTIRQREGRPPLVSPYTDAFFEELSDFLPHLESAFFAGGEPFLSRLNDRTWQLMLDLGAAPHVGVTTNGTVLNDRVEELMHALRMNISISVDGHTAATNEAIRLGVDHTTLLRNRERFVEVASGYGGVVRLNFALQRSNWHELADYLRSAEDQGFDVWLSPVRAPAEVSILHLPLDDLERIDRSWDRQEALVADLPVNRKSWDQARSEVRAQLSAARAESLRPPARVALRTRLGSSDRRAQERDVRAAVDELTAWAGRDPIVILAESGLVIGATVPGWARDWLPPAPEGSALETVVASMEERTGGAKGLTEVARGPGRLEVRGDLGGEGAPLGFRTFDLSWPDAGARTALVVAVLDASTATDNLAPGEVGR